MSLHMKQDQRLSMYTVLYRSLSGSLTKDLLTKKLHQQHDHRPNIYMNYQGPFTYPQPGFGAEIVADINEKSLIQFWAIQ